MTEICVNTGALGGAAQGMHRLHSAADRRSHDVTAVARSLDLEIKARTHMDRHIAKVGRDVGVQAERLQRHYAFLTQSQRTYEDAERRVLSLIDRTGKDADGKSGADSVWSMFRNLWKEFLAGVAVVSPRLVQELFSRFARILGSMKDLVSVSKDFLDEYAHFVNNHMKLSELTRLKSLGTGTYAWAMRLQSLAKWVGKASMILSVIEAAQAGYQDFKSGVGSFAHRVGSSVVVGVATLGGGILGGLAGKYIGGVIGGAIGSVFPGPGTAIGVALGAAAGSWLGSLAGSKLATLTVSAGGEKSVKHLVGDAVDSEVKKAQTGATPVSFMEAWSPLDGIGDVTKAFRSPPDIQGRFPVFRPPWVRWPDLARYTVGAPALGPAAAGLGNGGGGGW